MESIWRTVRIGIHQDLKAMVDAVKKHSIISPTTLYDRSSDQYLTRVESPSFPLAQVEADIPLCRTTDLELTGKIHATNGEIVDALQLVGDLVSPEVGYALREQYLDQPEYETVLVPTNLRDAAGRVYVLRVHRGSRVVITGNTDDPKSLYVGDEGDYLWLGSGLVAPNHVWWQGSPTTFLYRPRNQ